MRTKLSLAIDKLEAKRRFYYRRMLGKPTCDLGYDRRAGCHYVEDKIAGMKVYLADMNRFRMYRNGIQARFDRLLSDYRISPSIIEENDVILDIGANSGELSLHPSFARATYIAIEPDPNAFRALKLNCAEGLLINCALSDKEAMQAFYLCSSEGDSSLFEPPSYTEKIDVEVQTLDGCLSKQDPIHAIKLLKIEAEGMEPEILFGGHETISKSKYIALDAGPERGGCSTAPQCLNYLFQRGFELRDTYLNRGTFLLENTSWDPAKG